MNKLLFLLISLTTLSTISFNSSKVNASTELQSKVINSTDWMGELPRELKLTELNLPGVHDAGTAHTTATAFSLNTVCQTFYIGNHTYYNREIFSSNKTVTEPGLMEQGVRYFDIRYDTDNYNPNSESDVKKRDDFINSFPVEKQPLELMKFASEHIQLQHNFYVCRYLVEDYYGWGDWEDITNLKLMDWIKKFLDKHPTETIILDISAEDGDEDDQAKIASVCTDFFKTLATYGGYGVFPEVYVGTKVPTLQEAAGKMVIITDMDCDLVVKDEQKNVIGHWAFLSGYSEGDSANKTFARAKTDTFMKSRVYKNNRYDGITKDVKWEYVQNGLRDAKTFYNLSISEGYDPWMLLYTSENRVFKGTPKTFAEYINPLVRDYIEANNNIKKYQYYGILAMDFMNDPEIVENMSEIIWSSNFYNDYSEFGAKYDFSNYDITYKNNAPLVATMMGDGNLWILIGGLVLLAGALTAGIIIGVKRRKKKNNKATPEIKPTDSEEEVKKEDTK